jgi:hypothetical protein
MKPGLSADEREGNLRIDTSKDMDSHTRKLLLIGATGYERAKEGLRLDCVNWHRLEDVQNVRDYDTLVINLLGLSTEAARAKVAWQKFNQLLDFSGASDILTHEGTILVLGDPRFDIPNESGTGMKPFLEWTGAKFEWDNQPGDTVQVHEAWNRPDFTEYAKNLRKWHYSLSRCSLNRQVFEQRWSSAFLNRERLIASVEVYPARCNRYGGALAFCIKHLIRDTHRERIPYRPICFLPEISVGEEETLLIVLRDFCDAASELREPDWVSGFTVPGQKEIDDRIAQLQMTIKAQNASLRAAMEDRSKARLCLKLLYEREYALEPVVRNILRELGATVEDPIEKNKEDGWITIELAGKKYEGVLEIKSAKSDQFTEDGRRQVLDWIDRGRTIRGKDYKGIFIGNSAVTKPLKNLGDRPDAFSDGWKKAAKLAQICAMKTEYLFLIYLLHKEGKISLDDFWAKIFTTNGIFDITPFRPGSKKQV